MIPPLAGYTYRMRASFCALALAPLLSGCMQARYLTQAAGGQVDLLQRSRPVVSVLWHRDAPPHTLRVLSRTEEIKAFARAHGLDTARSYEQYAALPGEAVVWVVQAAPALSLEEVTWSFPFVGSVPYLGYFERPDAETFAAGLANSQALDVYVRGASAYSTLGWLDDPILSTMIPDGPEAMGEFANVILHESVHATVYVSGQSAFNESLASFVGDGLTAAWLAKTFGEDGPVTRVWHRYHAWSRERGALMRRAWETLDALYRSDLPDPEKLEEKARILSALEQALETSQPINNATLSGYRTYAAGEAAFARLFQACGRSHARLVRAVKTLDPDDFPAPQAEAFDEVLDRLGQKGCPDSG